MSDENELINMLKSEHIVVFIENFCMLVERNRQATIPLLIRVLMETTNVKVLIEGKGCLDLNTFMADKEAPLMEILANMLVDLS